MKIPDYIPPQLVSEMNLTKDEQMVMHLYVVEKKNVHEIATERKERIEVVKSFIQKIEYKIQKQLKTPEYLKAWGILYQQ
jgi:hypothetical protein